MGGKAMKYLNLDENGYLLSIGETSGGIEADIDLSDYDFTESRINAYRYVNGELMFDNEKYAQIEAESVTGEPTQRTAEQRIAQLEAALELLLSGATE